MTNVIQQSVTLDASPEELFRTFLDSKRHSAMTGATARTSRRVGASFTAFDGELQGQNLMIVPNRLIVQAWRARQWKTADLDSILILRFSKAANGARIELTHVNVPAYDRKGVRQGWPKFYWKPWKAYLARR
jgi:activator of HSP90 ATPase